MQPTLPATNQATTTNPTSLLQPSPGVGYLPGTIYHPSAFRPPPQRVVPAPPERQRNNRQAELICLGEACGISMAFTLYLKVFTNESVIFTVYNKYISMEKEPQPLIDRGAGDGTGPPLRFLAYLVQLWGAEGQSLVCAYYQCDKLKKQMAEILRTVLAPRPAPVRINGPYNFPLLNAMLTGGNVDMAESRPQDLAIERPDSTVTQPAQDETEPITVNDMAVNEVASGEEAPQLTPFDKEPAPEREPEQPTLLIDQEEAAETANNDTVEVVREPLTKELAGESESVEVEADRAFVIFGEAEETIIVEENPIETVSHEIVEDEAVAFEEKEETNLEISTIAEEETVARAIKARTGGSTEESSGTATEPNGLVEETLVRTAELERAVIEIQEELAEVPSEMLAENTAEEEPIETEIVGAAPSEPAVDAPSALSPYCEVPPVPLPMNEGVLPLSQPATVVPTSCPPVSTIIRSVADMTEHITITVPASLFANGKGTLCVHFNETCESQRAFSTTSPLISPSSTSNSRASSKRSGVSLEQGTVNSAAVEQVRLWGKRKQRVQTRPPKTQRLWSWDGRSSIVEVVDVQERTLSENEAPREDADALQFAMINYWGSGPSSSSSICLHQKELEKRQKVMLEYEKFVQKMLALNLHEVLPLTAEAIQYNFFLYSAIHWTEVSLSIEALHQGLTSLGVSPKDARTKSLKMFQDLLPLRVEEAKKRFLAGCGLEKRVKSRLAYTKITCENSASDSSSSNCSHNFDSLEALLAFTREKATELSNCKENKTEPPPPPEAAVSLAIVPSFASQVLSHLVDDVFVVRDPQGLLRRKSADSLQAVREENKKLRRLVNKLEMELTKQT